MANPLVYHNRMNLEQIRQRAGRTKPFALQLSNGQRLVVKHPDFVALGAHIVVVIDENDRVITLDPRHIVSIEDDSGDDGALLSL